MLPDVAERRAVAQAIVGSANPSAHVAEMGPRQPIRHPDPATQAAIVAVADRDFVQGIRVALGVAVALLVLVLVAGYRGFPRGGGALKDAQREAASLEATET